MEKRREIRTVFVSGVEWNIGWKEVIYRGRGGR